MKKIKPCAVGPVSIGAMSLLLLALLLPIAKPTANATDCAPGEEPCTTTLAETNIDLMVKSTVSVALQSAVNLEVVPRSAGAFAESTSKLTVATNNPSGYAVYMQAGEVTNGKASLKSSDLSNTATIAPVEGVVDNSSFQSNTWGYSLDGGGYQAVPATTGLVKETTSTTFSDTYDLSFGVNIDTNLPSGQYTNSVIVSAVANPLQITSLSQLIYMQDMKSDICTNTAEKVTKQLIDTRDGKSYWVAKMADGNCWMTQNLALTITPSMIDNGSINSGNTDIGYDENGILRTIGVNGRAPENNRFVWDVNGNSNYCDDSEANCHPPMATIMELGKELFTSNQSTFSYDIGKWVLATPNRMLDCSDNAESVTSLETCQGAGAVNVSDGSWHDNFKAQLGTWQDIGADSEPYSGYVSADVVNKTYDAHYLTGNYYQYNTAAAGSGTQNANQDAVDSICPKGWKLPVTIQDSVDTDKSYAKLFTSYGIPAWGNYGHSSSSGMGLNGKYHAAASPLSFVRAGYIILSKIGDATDRLSFSSEFGKAGSYVSSTSYKYLSNMYTFGFTTGVNFWGYPNRAYTLVSLRCVSR